MFKFKNSLQKKLRSRFHVSPTFGVEFSGILIQCDKGEDGYSVFTDVIAYPDQAEPTPIQGDLYIQNYKVAYSQLVK